MKIDNVEMKHNMVSRLKRIEGQIRGVTAMVEDERDCKEILQQLAAARSALQGATQVFLQEYASHCLANLDETNDAAQRERILNDLIAMIGKTA